MLPRLADPRLARLNRGLLGFRVALYLSVIVSLYTTEIPPSPLVVATLVLLTFVPGLPLARLRDVRVEVGVSISLAVAFGLWWEYGPLLAIEWLPLFSLTVSGLLLPKRLARSMVGTALLVQVAALAIELSARSGVFWPGLHSVGPSPITRLVLVGLVAAVGYGFVTVGEVLLAYQNEIAERSRVETRLTEVVRHKNNLINSVAHELRTPLTAVFGFAQALGDAVLKLDEEDRSALARSVAIESRRLVNVVDNLIVEARVEATGLAVSGEAVDICDEIRTIWNQFNLDEQWELFIEGSGTVWVDRPRLRQLLTNLVDNALTVGASPLRVAISAGTDRLVGEFENGGKPIFEPFGEVLIDQVPTARGHTGLGLRAARTLAQSMSGDLHYREGAFVLSLPRMQTTSL